MTAHVATVEAIPFRIPFRSPLDIAYGRLDAAEHLLIVVTDGDGVSGFAEAIPRPMMYGDTLAGMRVVLEEILAPRVVGRSPFDSARILADFEVIAGNHTIKAATDMALTDLRCRRLGVSINQLLGGFSDSVAVTAILGFGSPDDVAAEARGLRDRHGITAFKVKVGRTPAHDIEVCRAVRAEIGEDALLYVDANKAYDLFDFAAFADGANGVGVGWIEEPTDPDDIETRTRIGRAGLPVLGDESCATPGQVVREVSAGRVDAVSLKVSRSGYRVADRIRGYCEASGVPIVMGSQGDSDVGTLSILGYATAHASTTRYPAEYAFFLHLADSILQEPLVVTNGRLHVRDVPGSGIEIDDERLARYRIDGGAAR